MKHLRNRNYYTSKHLSVIKKSHVGHFNYTFGLKDHLDNMVEHSI